MVQQESPSSPRLPARVGHVNASASRLGHLCTGEVRFDSALSGMRVGPHVCGGRRGRPMRTTKIWPRAWPGLAFRRFNQITITCARGLPRGSTDLSPSISAGSARASARAHHRDVSGWNSSAGNIRRAAGHSSARCHSTGTPEVELRPSNGSRSEEEMPDHDSVAERAQDHNGTAAACRGTCSAQRPVGSSALRKEAVGAHRPPVGSDVVSTVRQ